MTYEQLLRHKNFILLNCISGSKAYNLNLPKSDTDKKGVFILPKKNFYGFDTPEQLANSTNDEVYFEIKRFIELLTKNNPNILELLSTPKECILSKHPLMDLIKPEEFLSKLCLDTFAGYAQTQIRKAKGLNKKINRPIKDVKNVLDFCYVIQNNGSTPVIKWLSEARLNQQECGLLNLPHFRDVYLLFHQSQLSHGYFRGIVSRNDADEVQLSPIPKGLEPLAVMNFNKDGYSTYCKEYKEFKEWEEKRNTERYESTLAHGKNYDAKNMMHTFRLLNMAEEIAIYKKVNVFRNDRDFLLNIRKGEFEFDYLLQLIEDKILKIRMLYEKSDLPERPDSEKAESLLIEIRERFYNAY
jgi:hypothetical protein